MKKLRSTSTDEALESSGKLAKQASGSVLVRYGDTVVLVTRYRRATARKHRLLPADRRLPGKDLRGGKIPGGFFKREGSPPKKRCDLAADRPAAAANFAEGFLCETQVIATCSPPTGKHPDVSL